MYVSRDAANRRKVLYYDWQGREQHYYVDENGSSNVHVWKEQPRLNKNGRWVSKRGGCNPLYSFCAPGFRRGMGLSIKRGECFKLTGSFSNPRLGKQIYS